MSLNSRIYPIRGRYDENEAVLHLRVENTRWAASYDEDEVDRMLRVIEHCGPNDPITELAEMFEGEFGAWATRIAEHVVSNAETLAALVYDESH